MSNMNQLRCVPSAAPANNSNMIYSLQPVSMAAPAMAAPTDLNKNTPNPHMLQNAQMLVPAASQATHFMTPTNVPLGPLAQIPTPPSPHVLPEAQLHDPNVLYLYPQRPVGNQLPPQTPPQLHGSQSPFAGTAFLTPHCPSEGMMANGTPILPSCVSIPPSFHGGSSFPMPSTLLGPSAAMLHHQPTTPAVSSDVYMYNFPAGNLNTRMESTPPQPFYVFEGRTPSTMVSPFTPPALNPVPFGAHQQHHHAQARNSTVSSKRGSHGNNSMVGINPSRSWTNHVEEGKSYDQDPVPIDTTKRQLIVNFLPQRLTNEEFLSLFRPYGELDEAASHIIYDLRHANSQSKSTPHEGGSYAEDASGADNSSGICTSSSTSDPALPGLLNAASVTLTPKANPSGMRSKSYGFIYYKDGASTEAAIKELNGREVHNRRIKVRYANQQRSAMDMVPEAPPMESQKAREAAAIAQSRETTA